MTEIRFDRRVAVVTGSGRGLGAAYVKLLAARGAAVVVHDAGVAADGSGFDPGPADAVAAAISAAGGAVVTSYENIATLEGCRRLMETALDRFGRIDILVHNAGLLSVTPVEEVDTPLFTRMMRVNASSAFWLAQAAFPAMKQQRYGRIVLTTSGRAMDRAAALPGLACYSIGKMAQLGLMNALAAEGEPHGILVNAISPVAATRMLQREVEAGRLRPEQVAPGVAFLASEQCAVSGVILRAGDGHFSVARWAFSQGLSLADSELTPEQILSNWERIR